MFQVIKRFFLDEAGDTASVTYSFSPNTLALSAQVNQNFQDLVAILNDISSVNLRDDSVTAAKLNGDVVRATYGLIQHTDGSLYVDVSDTNPGLELSDGGLRVKVDGATINRGSSGIYINLTSEAQGDIMYRNASGWVRLPAGTSGQFLKTLGTGANPAWATVPFTDYRSGLQVSQASTTNMAVAPGAIEVNGTLVTKTAISTLVLSTAGDWAGGSSLRATNTTGFVGIDSSGNIKLHTTAPTHSDYALSITAGTKRYASWSSTTYRIIGWFRMNGTGSGELAASGVADILDIGVLNHVFVKTASYASLGSATTPLDNTPPTITEGNAISALTIGFRPTDVLSKIRVRAIVHLAAAANAYSILHMHQDGGTNAVAVAINASGNADQTTTAIIEYEFKATSLTYTEFTFRSGNAGGGAIHLNGSASAAAGLFNGTLFSSVEITEIPSQLT